MNIFPENDDVYDIPDDHLPAELILARTSRAIATSDLKKALAESPSDHRDELIKGNRRAIWSLDDRIETIESIMANSYGSPDEFEYDLIEADL